MIRIIHIFSFTQKYDKIIITKEFFEKTFGYQFNENDTLKIDRIIQRKEMTRALREKYNLQK